MWTNGIYFIDAFLWRGLRLPPRDGGWRKSRIDRMYGQTQMREHGGVLPSVRFWWRIWRIWLVSWFAKTAPYNRPPPGCASSALTELAIQNPFGPVSYSHLTLPTVLSVLLLVVALLFNKKTYHSPPIHSNKY